MNEPIEDLQDKYADNFKDQVFTPADLSGTKAVIDDILRMTAQVLQWREAKALSLGGAEGANNAQHTLMQQESEIGAKIFGLLKSDQQRSFFCFNRTTWIWYESWIDPVTRQNVSQTMRYEISDAGVAKSSQAVGYQLLDGRELENFYNAVKVYNLLVSQQIYGQEA